MASLRRKDGSKYWFACFTLPNGRQTQRGTKQTGRTAAQKVADTYERVGQTKMSEGQIPRVMADLFEQVSGQPLASSSVRDYIEQFLSRKERESSQPEVRFRTRKTGRQQILPLAPPSSDSSPLLIKEARESWIKLCESLRKFEMLVEQNRRETGELIPRSEMQKFVRHFCTRSRVTFRFKAEALTNQIIGLKEIECYAILRSALDETLFKTVLSYAEGDGDSRMAETARQFIKDAFIVTDEQIEKYLEDWLKLATSKHGNL